MLDRPSPEALPEEPSRKDEERLRLAQDVGGIALWEYDIAASTVEWSPQGYRIYGVAPDWEPSYANFLALVHPEDRQRVQGAVERGLSTRQPFEHQFRIVTPDGEVRWVISRATFLIGPAPDQVRLMGADIDITALKMTEQRLQEREDELERLQKIAGIAEFWVDLREDGVCWYSDDYRRIHGLSRQVRQETRVEWVGRLHPEDRARAERAFDSAVANGLTTLRIEYRIIRASDGSMRWIEAAAEIERDIDGAPLRLIAIHRDITERKEAEERARLSEERLQLALDASQTVGTWVWDIPNDRAFPDVQTARLFALDPERAAMGVPASVFFAPVHPEDRPEAECKIASALEIGGEFELEYRLVSPDGQLRWISERGRVEHGADGKPLRALGVSIDISKMKELQTAHELLANELLHRSKNTFSLISALSTLAAKGRSQEVQQYASDFRRRLHSLSAALIYMQSRFAASTEQQQTIMGLLNALLSPFSESDSDRIRLEGADAPVGEASSTLVALLVHELATNALKYGSLSTEVGTVAISCEVEGEVHIVTWRERGGPVVHGPPEHRGFGTETTVRLASERLGGSIRYDWEAEGVTATLRLPLDRLAQ